MKAKKAKNGIKVLISLVIAITITGIPAVVFADSGGDSGGDGNAVEGTTTDVLYGESGTPPYDPANYGRHEDNRHVEENGWYDPYAADRGGQVPPDVDVTYLDVPDPTVPHETSETNVVATVTNWDDVPHEVKVFLQIYEEIEPDPFTFWFDDMESCCHNWTAVDVDDDGVTWGWTEKRSYSPTHSYHNVYDCVMDDNGGTYVGNSLDQLISREIDITGLCDGTPSVWLNFKQWIQGEVSEEQGKFEDYGKVYYRIDGGAWVPLAIYADSEGEWLTADPDDFGSDYVLDIGTFTYSHGAPVGWFIPLTPDNTTIQIMFEWHSDPCTQFEGWYIDDVTLMAQCGGMQPLVWQEYKPVDEAMYLGAFNETAFQKQVQFMLPFTPKDDTTYFFEVYSELIDDDDVDGHYDFEGDNEFTTQNITWLGIPDTPEGWFIDPMTGARYWNPKNGVNESVYFGDWHDGAGISVYFGADGNEIVQIEKTTECIDVPISYVVANEGTIEEPIPYQIEVHKTAVENVFYDDYEQGDTDYYLDQGYEIGYFANPNCVLPHVETEMLAHSGTNAWYFGDAVCPDQNEGYYGSNMYCAFRTPEIDMNEYIGVTTTHLNYWVNFNINNELGPSPGYTGHFDPGYSDKWYFGVITDAGIYLFLSSTATSGTSGGWLPVESTNTPGEISGYNAVHPGNPWYPIIITAGPETTEPDLMTWLRSIGYDADGKIAFFWAMATGDANNNYPDEPWSGLYVDDVQLWGAGLGETIWSSDMMYETLEPGEQSDELTILWNACDYCDYTPVVKTHVEDDWNTHFKGDPDLGYMYNDEAQGSNLYIYTELYDEDFEGGGWMGDVGEFGSEWSTHDNTFGEPGQWVICDDGAPGWQLNHFLYTGDGDDSYENSYDNNRNDLVVPADGDGILAFDLTDMVMAQLRFDLWNEIETDWDYLTLEISNDSGDNWWTIAHWNNVTNYGYNMEEWVHYDMELFNGTDYIVAYNLYVPACPYIDPYPPCEYFINISYVNVSITEDMHFRFHFMSDSGYAYKGAYIDNIELVSLTNETVPYDGTDQPWRWTEEVLFEDDFEDGMGKWHTLEPWTGSMWHVSDTCSYPDDDEHCAANFDPYTYSSYNKQLYPAQCNLSGWGLPPAYWHYTTAMYFGYDSSYMNYRNNADDKLILDLDLSGVYQAWLRFYTNYTVIATGDFLYVEVSTDGGETWNTIATYQGDSGGWVAQSALPALGYTYNYGISLTPFTGGEALIRWRLVSDETDVGAIQIDDILVTGKRDTEAPVTTAIVNPPEPDGCNGWYTSDVTVTLTAVDREMGTTYYSIDGGTWLTYTGPITIGIDGEHTISYYSVDAVGNEETAKSVSFNIDKTAPTGSITSPEAGYIYFFGRQIMPRILDKSKALIIGGLTATATASDATSGVGYVTFSTSKGSVEDAVSPYEYNLPFYFPFGTDTLTVTVTDKACNTANAGSVDYIKIL